MNPGVLRTPEPPLFGTLSSPTGTNLGSPAVPFCPFWFGASLQESSSRKKGTLIVKGLPEKPSLTKRGTPKGPKEPEFQRNAGRSSP